jgi:hypothetical protein
MNEDICHAIRERRLLQLEYKGFARLIAPHVYGLDNSGDEMLSGYQIKGGTGVGPAIGWKSFKIHGIRDLSVTGRGFRPRPDFRYDDPAMKQIFCQLD